MGAFRFACARASEEMESETLVRYAGALQDRSLAHSLDVAVYNNFADDHACGYGGFSNCVLAVAASKL